MSANNLATSRTPSASPVGALLREWRGARRMSQLDLALTVNVSSRHLSFVETGRAQPSREMILRLANALEMPLRERNTLLLAAGYAPMYDETQLSAPEMAQVRRAIELTLQQQEPYPAVVVNRHWDLLMANRASSRIFGFLRGGSSAHTNVMRQVFDPRDLRAAIVNWDEVAEDLIRHLHDEVASAPTDDRARALLTEVLAYPGVRARWRTRQPGVTPPPVLTAVYRRDGHELRFFSTIATFGTPRNVTLDELRIECAFPADEATAEFCKAMADISGTESSRHFTLRESGGEVVKMPANHDKPWSVND